MLFSLLYLVLRGVLRLAPAGDERDRDAEILVLRHQVKVLKRRTCRPKLSRLDKLFLAGLTRPPQGALVKLRRHADHSAPLASRARPSQVDLQGQTNGKATHRS